MKHREERPWGYFSILEEGQGYKIKKICVRPGHRLSLQKHSHRSEYWTFVKGLGKVVIENVVKECSPGDQVHIPLGACHRLENQGEEDLIVLEVQLGSYLGEDDIVRIEDDYHRLG